MPLTAKNVAQVKKFIRENTSPTDFEVGSCIQCRLSLTNLTFFMYDKKLYCIDCFSVLPYIPHLRYRELRKAAWSPKKARELVMKELTGESEWIIP
jgi:hypothetical protein